MQLAALLLAAALSVGQPDGGLAAGEEDRPAFEGSTQEFVVKATAYTSGPESTGKRPGHPQYGLTATGSRATEGRTIAVDPRVIPLGSLVHIEELDQDRIAEDTGGAIRGERIDLYMKDVPDALNWGVRDVRIHVYPKI
jgi:3D (Asp-Asp-Asp) domain-containing protein